MRYAHFRNIDLNLLVGFQILMEERSITRAARRIFLSQPAMSRVVDRLQEMFKDELLVRTRKGYEPTQRALDIYMELEQVLPRIEAMFQGSQFDPKKVRNIFRIDAGDSATVVFVSEAMKMITRDAPGIRIEIMPRTDFQRLEANDCDLVLATDVHLSKWIGKSARALSSEPLLRDHLVCLVRAGHPLTKGRVTLARYLKAEHVAIAPVEETLRTAIAFTGDPQRNVAQVLEPTQNQRVVRMSLPYGMPIGRIVQTTDLVATILFSMARRLRTRYCSIIAAPIELRTPITCVQVWHPRNDNNATHRWLRALLREVAATDAAVD